MFQPPPGEPWSCVLCVFGVVVPLVLKTFENFQQLHLHRDHPHEWQAVIFVRLIVAEGDLQKISAAEAYLSSTVQKGSSRARYRESICSFEFVSAQDSITKRRFFRRVQSVTSKTLSFGSCSMEIMTLLFTLRFSC